MSVPRRLAFNSRIGMKMLLRCASTSSQASWSNNAALPGGFNADGLREWAILTDFGADGHETVTGQQMRRRRRQITEENEPYADLFYKRVSNECSDHLARHHSPVDILGQAFFGSRNFMGERMILSSLNSVFSLYPEEALTLPTQFKSNEQYLQWKITMKAPLELICSYHIKGLNFRGCTMLAFDPSLRRVYHGNVINVAEKRTKEEFLPDMGSKIHVKYAKFLLDGMVEELEQLAEVKH